MTYICFALFLCLLYVNYIYNRGIKFLLLITVIKLIGINNERRHCMDKLGKIK